MEIVRSVGRNVAHSVICLHACSSVQYPIGTTIPVSSAIGTKMLGEIMPRSGCSHRNNASKATMPPSSNETMGW